MADRTIDNPRAQTIEPGIVQRVSQGIRYALTGKTPVDWFGPQKPIPAQAPEEVAGRAFDYPVGFNLRLRPKQDEGISFTDLRGLADAHNVTRLCIETVKDQMVKLQWAITPKDKDKDIGSDPRVQALTEFWMSPDKEHSWQQWLRQVMEDMLVIDATTLYPRMDKGGKLWAFELVDGATIKRCIDQTGRTPLPPEPAYQQILKGLPAVDYTRDEIIYYPRNKRTNKIYGMSNVEQIIMFVNIALRRDISQLQYYTEGNIPDTFINVPDDWTPDQIAQFQAYWDSILEGNTAQRRKAKFIPGKMSPTFTADPKLKDEYDEWIARIVTYCFSLPPLPFVKQMNRATAQSDIDRAKEEGAQPRMAWVKDLVNFCNFKYFGITDLEWDWKEEEDIDPFIRAQIMDIKLKNGVINRNQWRNADGDDPIEGGEEYTVSTGVGVQLLKDVLNPMDIEEEEEIIPPVEDIKASPEDKKESQAEKIEKAKKKVFRALSLERPSALRAARKIKKAAVKLFKAMQPKVIDTITKGLEKANKADMDLVEMILNGIDLKGFSVLIDPTQEALDAIYREAGKHGIKNLATLDLPNIGTGEQLIESLNEKALEFARTRATELVGMKYVDGDLVENPKAEWAITDSTREALRSKITSAIDEGWSPQHLADEIEASGLFSEDRAELIARSEIKNADNQGTLDLYRETGLDLEKQWVVSADHPDEDDCDENAGEGWIDFEDTFSSGDDAPGSHPRCMCSMEIRVKGE